MTRVSSFLYLGPEQGPFALSFAKPGPANKAHKEMHEFKFRCIEIELHIFILNFFIVEFINL